VVFGKLRFFFSLARVGARKGELLARSAVCSKRQWGSKPEPIKLDREKCIMILSGSQVKGYPSGNGSQEHRGRRAGGRLTYNRPVPAGPHLDKEFGNP
jgi:hypothetical protein